MSIEPIHKAPTIQTSGNVILLDNDGVVPCWDLYTFSINVKNPGEKVSVIY